MIALLRRFRAPGSAEILAELLDELHSLRRSPRHIYGLSNDLSPFIDRFPDLRKANEKAIANFLRSLQVGPRRRDNILAGILQLSLFAKSRNYLDENRRCAAERIKRINAARGSEIAVWTLPETRILLDRVSEKWRPFLVIGLFAGLRTSEILRLDWSHIDFEHHLIYVSAKIARKTRLARTTPIAENLAEWLAPYRDRVGPVYPGNFKTNENLRGIEMSRVRLRSGLPRKDNALRHSYGSYRLSITRNYEQVAFEMGNSPRVIRWHYHRPLPESEGRSFFSLRPASLENVIRLIPQAVD